VILVLVTGALAGVFHVLSGPDHLAAVAPLATADGRRGWMAGWTWGVGHASGVVVVAALGIELRDVLPPIDVISGWSERIVGGALIAIGLWALRRSAHIGHGAHAHGAVAHDHVHVQAGPRWMRRLGHAHASFYMGILHGVAGTSHFLGVLPALALPSPSASFAYIGAFGAGTVAAMTAFAAVLASVGRRLHPGSIGYRRMMRAAAALALSVGAWWLVVGAI
jgi:hypothetical protein